MYRFPASPRAPYVLMFCTLHVPARVGNLGVLSATRAPLRATSARSIQVPKSQDRRHYVGGTLGTYTSCARANQILSGRWAT